MSVVVRMDAPTFQELIRSMIASRAIRDFVNKEKAFALSKVMMTALDVDLFPLLREQQLTIEEIVEELGIDKNIASAFLGVLVAAGLLSFNSGKYGLTEPSTLVLSTYQDLKSWTEEMKLFYSSLVNLTEFVRSGHYQTSDLSAYWAYKQDPSAVGRSIALSYSEIMDASQVKLSNLIAEQYDFSRHSHLVDMGGGLGRFAVTLAKRFLDLRVTIVDLPPVCQETESVITENNLSERITCLGIDFFEGTLPKRADIVTFIRVLHDWSDEKVLELLTRASDMLTRNGVVMIVEPMDRVSAETDLSSSITALMLTLMGGRRRTVEEYTEMFQTLGLRNIQCIDLGWSKHRIVLARKQERG